MLRPSGSFGSCGRPVRTNGLCRAAARAECRLAIVSSRINRALRAQPSPVVASRAGLTVNVSGPHGVVDAAPPWGLFEAPVLSRAFRFGEGSFAGPYNIALEPSRPTVGCHSVAAARGSARPLAGLELWESPKPSMFRTEGLKCG